jgi:hypothetical protein
MVGARYRVGTHTGVSVIKLYICVTDAEIFDPGNFFQASLTFESEVKTLFC